MNYLFIIVFYNLLLETLILINQAIKILLITHIDLSSVVCDYAARIIFVIWQFSLSFPSFSTFPLWRTGRIIITICLHDYRGINIHKVDPSKRPFLFFLNLMLRSYLTSKLGIDVKFIHAYSYIEVI